MEVTDYDLKDDYISLTLCNKECLVGNYYFKNISEVKEIKYGIKVKVIGELNVPSENTVPKSFNYKNYLNNKGIYYTLKISSIDVINNDVSYVNRIRNWLCRWVDSFDTTGYVKGLVLGIKDNIDEDEYSKYQIIGVTHLFAISGMHISVVVVILNKILGRLNEKIRYLIIDVVLLFYGAVLYFPASLKRTIWFYIINSFNKIFGLKISSLKVLFLVVFSLVIYDYRIIYDIGFIYSVFTVGGIIYSGEFIKSDNKLISCFKLSLIAFLFSLPISLYNFYSINLLSVFYNMFYVFFVSSIIYPFSLLLLFIPKLYFLYEILITFLLCLTDLLANIDFLILYLDFNVLEVLLFYLFLILFVSQGRKIYFVLMLIIVFTDLIMPYFDSNAYVYFFDVGQGDSSLVIKPHREEIIMIDTGGVVNRNVSDSVISFLKSRGIKKIDYLILSHGDFDHMGDAINIAKNINLDNVVFNHNELNELEYEFIDYLIAEKTAYSKVVDIGDVFSLNNNVYDNENDSSSVLLFDIYGYKFLFTGDVSVDVENELVKKYNLSDIDVLKVGHHGSKTSSGKLFIDELNPKYSIISVGKNNSYGHPSDIVLDILVDTKIYRTDLDGSIIFKINKNILDVETVV